MQVLETAQCHQVDHLDGACTMSRDLGELAKIDRTLGKLELFSTMFQDSERGG